MPDTQYSLVYYSLSACMCTFTNWYTCDTRVSRSKIFNEIRTAHPTSSVNVDFNLQFLCCHHQDNLYYPESVSERLSKSSQTMIVTAPFPLKLMLDSCASFKQTPVIDDTCLKLQKTGQKNDSMVH